MHKLVHTYHDRFEEFGVIPEAFVDAIDDHNM